MRAETTQAITDVLVPLQAYLDEGKGRYRVIGSKNSARETLVTDLISEIQNTEVSTTIMSDEAKLQHIADEISHTLVTNNTAGESARARKRILRDPSNPIRHEGSSTDALDKALLVIKLALAVERSFVIQEKDVEIARQAGLVAAAPAQVRTQVAQEQTAAAAEAKTATLVDPLKLVSDAITRGTFNELDFPAVDARLTELITMDPPAVPVIPLTSEQKIFYADLEAKLNNQQLPVGEALLTALVRSPLAARYEKLRKDAIAADPLYVAPTAAQPAVKPVSSKELRTMIETMGEIISLCLHNGENSLQDLHNLFVLQDEKKLRELLTLLQEKKMLSNTFVPAVEPMIVVPAVARKAALSALLGKTTLPNGKLDMAQVEATVATAGAVPPDPAAVVEVAKLLAIKSDMTLSANYFVHCVKVSSTISLLIAEINVSKQRLITLSRKVDSEHRNRLLIQIGTEIKNKFTMLAGLHTLLNQSQAKLTSVVTHLNAVYAKQKAVQSQDRDIQLEKSLAVLNADFTTWNTNFRDAEAAVERALTALEGTLDLAGGAVAGGNLETAATTASEEERCLLKIRRDIALVRRELAKHTKSTDVANVAAKMPKPEVALQKLSVEFLVKLANKFSESKEDFESAVDLIKLLQADGLFTTDLQLQLLVQKNIDVLLKLQEFLVEVHIDLRATPEALIKLWNNLHGNPDFKKLVILQKQLGLDTKALLSFIENFTPTWNRSLLMLNEMFKKRSDKIAAIALIEAAKNDHGLIEKVYKIHQAIAANAPGMMADFSSVAGMKSLIDLIAVSEDRFTDEVVVRLKAVGDAPFKPREDFAALLKQTKSLMEENLSYVSLLPEWSQHRPSTAPFFGDAVSYVLQGHSVAVYNGAQQVNARKKEDIRVEPDYVNISSASWLVACAYPTPQLVDFDALTVEARKQAAGQVNLDPARLFFLQLTEMALRAGGITIKDRERNPNMVAWVSRSSVGAPTEVQFMDYYSHLTVSTLDRGVNKLADLIKQAVVIRDGLAAGGQLFADAYMSELEIASRPAASATPVAGASAQLIQLHALIDQITQLKSDLMGYATQNIRDAFRVSGSVAPTVAQTMAHRLLPQPVLSTVRKQQLEAEAASVPSRPRSMSV